VKHKVSAARTLSERLNDLSKFDVGAHSHFSLYGLDELVVKPPLCKMNYKLR